MKVDRTFQPVKDLLLQMLVMGNSSVNDVLQTTYICYGRVDWGVVEMTGIQK